METIREAVFQEEKVVQVEKIEIADKGERRVCVSFEGRLSDGGTVSMEVNA